MINYREMYSNNSDMVGRLKIFHLHIALFIIQITALEQSSRPNLRMNFVHISLFTKYLDEFLAL